MIQEKIIEISKSLNIDLIGFTKIKYYKELEKLLIKQDNLNYKTSFQKGYIDEKTFKINNFSEMKSAIVFGIAYNKNNIKLKNDEVMLSSYCWGNDYHNVLREKLEKIKNFIVLNNKKALIFVDNNILDERFIAREAGLGFYGINNQLINEKFGSYFFIGIILTDLIFKYNKKNNNKCLECGKCIDACPTKAINKDGILDGNKCLSYLTQKKNITKDEKKYFNRTIFGCDICSQVCPHNMNIRNANNFKFSGIELIKISDFNKLSKDEFNKIYKNSSCMWRGKNILERNIKIIEEKIAKK